MVEEIIQKHQKNKNYIAVLQSIQEKFGYIPKDETHQVAKALGLPLVKLWGVATFYSQFKLEKEGQNVIQVCDGTACHVNNSDFIIDLFKEELGIDPGKTTQDGKFTLEIVNCIGACAAAPAIMLNGTVHGFLDENKVKDIIKSLKRGQKIK